MNKKKTGSFIKSLRESKGLTQEDLVKEFSKFVGGIDVVSSVTISKWERGECFPDINNIKDLAKFFNVSVDEIFNGEKLNECDFSSIYFISTPEWKHKQSEGANLYKIENEQKLLIEKRFNELLYRLTNNTIGINEEKEFDYLCHTFYRLSEYGQTELGTPPASYIITYSAEWNNDDPNRIIERLKDLKFLIRTKVALMHHSSQNEKFWEAYKFFDYIYKPTFQKFLTIDLLEDNAYAISRLENCYFREKDLLLALTQYFNITHPLAQLDNGKKFIKTFGFEYNEEQLTKNAIRSLIESGACINKALIANTKELIERINILDVLYKNHVKYKKPLLIPVFDGNKYYYFAVENTEKNRALAYKDCSGNGMADDLIQEYETYLKTNGIFKTETSQLNIGLLPIELATKHITTTINKMPLNDYLKDRLQKKTEELLNDIDKLTLSQIREKYFSEENI